MAPRKVSTPGNYDLKMRRKKKSGKEKKQHGRISKVKKVGCPAGQPRKGSARKDNYRLRYTQEDLLAA
jgi:hypothetical protein